MNTTIKSVLMERDRMSSQEADRLIKEARQELHNRLTNGEVPMDICEEFFGLEPDYLIELL